MFSSPSIVGAKEERTRVGYRRAGNGALADSEAAVG